MNEHLQAHIEAIYDSVTREDGLVFITKRLIKDLEFRSGSVYLEALDHSSVRYECRIGGSEEQNKLYSDHFYKKDVWLQRLANAKKGQFHDSARFCPTPHIKKTEFYNDYLKYVDMAHAVGGYLVTDHDYGVRLAFHHTPKHGPIGSKADYLNLLVPHLKRAISLRQQLGESRSLADQLTDFVNRLPNAAIIVNVNRKVQYLNSSADKLLCQSKHLRLSNGCFSLPIAYYECFNKLMDTALQIARGHNHFLAGNTICVRSNGLPVYDIQIEPFRGTDQILGFEYPSPMALLIIKPLRLQDSQRKEDLQKRYNFSKKELLLAEDLLKGKTLADIAAESHRSINTLKTQLKSLFFKTKTNTQAKLIVQLNSC